MKKLGDETEEQIFMLSFRECFVWFMLALISFSCFLYGYYWPNQIGPRDKTGTAFLSSIICFFMFFMKLATHYRINKDYIYYSNYFPIINKIYPPKKILWSDVKEVKITAATSPSCSLFFTLYLEEKIKKYKKVISITNSEGKEVAFLLKRKNMLDSVGRYIDLKTVLTNKVEDLRDGE